jgi:hypothetical protein
MSETLTHNVYVSNNFFARIYEWDWEITFCDFCLQLVLTSCYLLVVCLCLYMRACIPTRIICKFDMQLSSVT